jgi:class 3 adenylate cyclase
MQKPISNQSRVGPVLRELLTWISDIIQSHGGIVDKFIGDEVMAYFRASLDDGDADEAEARAVCDSMVVAALEIRDRFGEEIDHFLDRLGVDNRPKEKPSIKCVINYDKVVWAVLGSQRYADLTILTDSVVRAARVMQHREGSKKLVGRGDIYVLQSVARRLSPGMFNLERVREIDLRDFLDEQVNVCRVVGYGAPAVASYGHMTQPPATI